MTREQRLSVKPYHPSDYKNRSQSPPPIGPLHDGPVGGEGDPDDPTYNVDHKDYWYYGQLAGGAQLWFGKYKGQRLHETSWSYLRWCRNNLTQSVLFQRAFDIYAEGVLQFAKDNYKDFIVPLGRVYRGMKLRQCRDKPWMLWLQNEARDKPEWKAENVPFFTALDQWLANPRRQGVKRDVGQSLKTTEWEDEHELLDPSQYVEDLGEFMGDEEYDEQDLIDADADPDGNLKGFITRDSASPEIEETEKSELEQAEERLEAQERARRKRKLLESPQKKGAYEISMPQEDLISESTDCEDSEQSDNESDQAIDQAIDQANEESDRPSEESDTDSDSASSYAHSDLYPMPPPETPKKPGKAARAPSPYITDDGSNDDEGDFSPGSDEDDSDVEESPRRRTRSMSRPQPAQMPSTPSRHSDGTSRTPRGPSFTAPPRPAEEGNSPSESESELQSANLLKAPLKRKARRQRVETSSDEEDGTPSSMRGTLQQSQYKDGDLRLCGYKQPHRPRIDLSVF
ncbi:hypothetical protein BKA70DRAFT_1500642 [Coprinopsis sp. MPI-PUGE-AT-0042]|nr:hypothetical protein BKA70DRAFT_1500642 [Coprinopsis sp. MPI-PUGE-AT-0042]